jgi:hypothetical protein
MTAAQKAAIVSPATGLLVYQTDGTAGYYYNSGTPSSPSWTQVGAASGSSQWTTTGNNVYYNTGNVGIGTTNPSLGLLQLTKTSGNNVNLVLEQSGVSTWDIRNSATSGNFGIYNGQLGTVSMAIDRANGYVGIGTTAPAKLLQVGGNVRGEVLIAGIDGSSPTLTLDHTATSSGRKYTLYSGGSSSGNFDIYDLTANAARLTISSTGNVGIGTTAPAYKLDVAGDVNVTGNFKVNGTNIPTTSGWGLSGNASTVDGTNFIGTTDNVALNFKANNLKAGRIDPAGSTFIGYQAGSVNTAATNTGFGYQALYSNTTGDYNAAMGNGALSANTTGGYNTASGNQSLRYNTTGVRNTASGYASLYSNTEGTYNTANGMFSLQNNTTGNNNTANGYGSMVSNTTGSYNTANGLESLHSNTTGEYNTASGYISLYSNITGSNNTALGYNAFANGTAFTNSTAIGNGADVTASNQVVLGNTSVTTTLLNGNVGIGTTTPNELMSLVQSSTSDIGVGIYNSTPYSAGNVAGGYLNLGKYEAAGPVYNPMVQLVGYPVTQSNSSEGALAIKTRKNGALTTQVTILNTGNVGIGTTTPAAKLHIAGPDPVTTLLLENTSANNGANVIMYKNQGVNQGYIGLGSSGSNDMYISAYGTTNSINLYNNDVLSMRILPNGNVGIGTTTPSHKLYVNGTSGGTNAWDNVSDKRLKKDVLSIENGLDKVMALRPITFNWNKTVNPELKLDDRNHLGFLAQEVETVLPQVVSTADDAMKTKSVAYSDIVPVLTKAIQEQQAIIEAQQKQIDKLTKMVEELMKK